MYPLMAVSAVAVNVPNLIAPAPLGVRVRSMSVSDPATESTGLNPAAALVNNP
jgi:hypothetical protein